MLYSVVYLPLLLNITRTRPGGPLASGPTVRAAAADTARHNRYDDTDARRPGARVVDVCLAETVAGRCR